MLGARYAPLVPMVLEMVPTGRNPMGQQEAEEAFVVIFWVAAEIHGSSVMSRGKKCSKLVLNV